eukprot:Seg1694.1 transcript_id=Seg1694.1/GoldUCD/mRNA.D3Y31 product="hypothetical protein" protein_id=Seg1694.1/GoldUCD/D3Y31
MNEGNSSLVLESLSTNDVGAANDDQCELQVDHAAKSNQTASVMKPATVTDENGCVRWSRFDHKPAFSYSAAFNEPDASLSLPQIHYNTNARPENTRSMSLGVNTHIREHEIIHLRPSVAYSRHMVEEVKQNEYQLSKQGRRPVFDTEWLVKSTSANPPSSRNNSLLLASGTEDLWRSSRRISSPGMKDNSESDFSSDRTTPVEGPSSTSAQYAPIQGTVAPAEDEIRNIINNTIDDDASDDSEGSDTMTCIHGEDSLLCTICNRPTGRCGREFKKKQDENKRKRQRKKGRFKNLLNKLR